MPQLPTGWDRKHTTPCLVKLSTERESRVFVGGLDVETSTLSMLGPTTETHLQPQPISPSLLSHRHENRAIDTHVTPTGPWQWGQTTLS